MSERFSRYFRRLPTRLVLSFIVVISLTSLLVGVPALFLVQGQLARQAEARVQQGTNATRALFTAQLREVQSLTTLSAQRPTLHRLLQDGDEEALLPYLETIRQATDVDVLLVANANGQLVIHAPASLSPTSFLPLLTVPSAAAEA